MKSLKLNKKDMFNIEIALKHFLISTPLATTQSNIYSDLIEEKSSYSSTLHKVESFLDNT